MRIGILTGGGDCQGLNAAIRAVAKSLMLNHQAEIIGIEDGFAGLIERRVRPLSYADCSGILARGGTILGTSNTNKGVVVNSTITYSSRLIQSYDRNSLKPIQCRMNFYFSLTFTVALFHLFLTLLYQTYK
jgi:6-phosphofructokinase